MLKRVLEKLLWSGHSSFIYEGEPLIDLKDGKCSKCQAEIDGVWK